MPSRGFCEVIETYDGFVVQLEGKKHCRLAVSRCSGGSYAYHHDGNLIKDVEKEPNLEYGYRSSGVYLCYYWNNVNVNIKVFEDQKDAIAMAIRVEEVLEKQHQLDKQAYERGLEAERKARERAAFVERKVWR